MGMVVSAWASLREKRPRPKSPLPRHLPRPSAGLAQDARSMGGYHSGNIRSTQLRLSYHWDPLVFERSGACLSLGDQTDFLYHGD